MRWLLLVALALVPVFGQSGGHYNIVARDTMEPGGNGRITMNNEGQTVSALQLQISGGPLNLTRVLVHFEDRKTFAMPVLPRTTGEWTSKPIQWPGGKARTVTALDYWYTGKTGKKPEIVVLGLQK